MNPSKLACRVAESFERLADILSKAGSKLFHLERYAEAFPEALKMQEALTTVYSDVIELCTIAIQFYKRRGKLCRPRALPAKMMVALTTSRYRDSLAFTVDAV